MKNKKLLIKIGVPILIVAVIVGMYVYKNFGKRDTNNSNQPKISNGENETTIPLSDNSVTLEKLKSYKLPIVIDFGATWCPPCRQFEPILRKLHAEMQGKVLIHYVDVDDNRNFSSQFPFKAIPTQFLYDKDGKPFVPSDELSREINFEIYKDNAGEHVFTYHEGALTEEQFRMILNEMGVS